MSTTTWTITDTITDATVTGDRFEVIDTIHGWYPDAPAEISAAIDDLDAQLAAGVHEDATTTLLGLTVTK